MTIFENVSNTDTYFLIAYTLISLFLMSGAILYNKAKGISLLN